MLKMSLCCERVMCVDGVPWRETSCRLAARLLFSLSLSSHPRAAKAKEHGRDADGAKRPDLPKKKRSERASVLLDQSERKITYTQVGSVLAARCR
jgi:hypothetical protein